MNEKRTYQPCSFDVRACRRTAREDEVEVGEWHEFVDDHVGVTSHQSRSHFNASTHDDGAQQERKLEDAEGIQHGPQDA
jgi:hypothetical protein